jgi:hypothetical protein
MGPQPGGARRRCQDLCGVFGAESPSSSLAVSHSVMLRGGTLPMNGIEQLKRLLDLSDRDSGAV